MVEFILLQVNMIATSNSNMQGISSILYLHTDNIQHFCALFTRIYLDVAKITSEVIHNLTFLRQK